MPSPVVIEAALNGTTTPDRNPHVPRTPAEIAADAVRCLDAGAAIVHTHNAEMAVDARTAAALYLEAWRPVLRERPDAILCPTVGFGATIDEKYAHVPLLAEARALRMSVVDPGSVNLGEIAYVNTPADIAHEAALCATHRLGPSIAIFEPGFLRTTLALHRSGRLPPGALVKLYFGGDHDYFGRQGPTFGLPPTRASLDVYVAMLEGSGLPWSVAVIGGDVVGSGMARLALERGGHVRVGLEDHAGARTPTNEELVREAIGVAREVGRVVASCAQALDVLGLPG
jgi:uncharacterized protein (DUF849 family)